MENTKVYLYRQENYDDATLYEHLENIFKETNVLDNLTENARIFVKLNLVGPFPPDMAITTNPVILDHVLTILKKKTNNILVGDNPAVRDQVVVMKKAGLYEVIQKHGVDLLDQTSLMKIQCSKPHRYNEFEVSRQMVEADLVINLPKVKTHTLAYMTCAEKNFFGLIYGLNKSSWHAKASNPEDFGEAFNDLFLAYLEARHGKPILSIADGILGLEGDGPSSGGKVVKGKCLLASLDPISLDRVAIEVMHLDYKKAYITRIAGERKIGNSDISSITIEGNSLLDFEDIHFLPPKDSLSHLGLKILRIKFVKSILLEHPKIDSSRCIQCGECAKICPPHAMTIKKGEHPSLHSTACIRCWCCAEVCPKNAISKTKRPLIGKIFLK